MRTGGATSGSTAGLEALRRKRGDRGFGARWPLTGLLSAPPHDYRDRAAAKQMASADTPEGGPSHGYCQGLPGAGRPGRRLFTDSNGLSRLTDS